VGNSSFVMQGIVFYDTRVLKVHEFYRISTTFWFVTIPSLSGVWSKVRRSLLQVFFSKRRQPLTSLFHVMGLFFTYVGCHTWGMLECSCSGLLVVHTYILLYVHTNILTLLYAPKNILIAFSWYMVEALRSDCESAGLFYQSLFICIGLFLT